jgi:hypothetical protein
MKQRDLIRLSLNLSPKQIEKLADNLLNLGLVKAVDGNWRLILIKGKNTSIGNVKKIYEELLKADERVIENMCEVLSKQKGDL